MTKGEIVVVSWTRCRWWIRFDVTLAVATNPRLPRAASFGGSVSRHPNGTTPVTCLANGHDRTDAVRSAV